MLFYGSIHKHTQNTIRKETLSPKAKRRRRLLLPKSGRSQSGKAFFIASPFSSGRRRGSLTVEASVVLPVFLFCMIALMQLFQVYDCAQRYSSALTQTAEEMAIGAYTSEYMEEDSLLGVVLSAAYAAGRVNMLAGDTSAVKHDNFLLSSFMEEDQLIEIVLTYQMKSPVGLIRLPGTVFLQEGVVRAWTGREGSSGEKQAEEQEHTTVYVTENGQVYHKDQNCTHLRLTIMPASRSVVQKMKNVNREYYKPCEICGRNAGEHVYITATGNRYHSSLECSGLKRTVHEVHLEDAGNLPPCSRCGR